MTLASTGAYAFTLHAPVDQAIGGEDSIAINLNGRVTVTDSGGPGADTNVPLNASITVIDDTPDAVVANTTAAAIVLDETRPLGTDSVGGVAPTGVASATGDFSANFAAVTDFGSDLPGSASYSLVLAGANQSATLSLSAFGPNVGGWTSQDQYPRELADVNGDGTADIVGFGNAGVYVSRPPEAGTLPPPHTSLPASARAPAAGAARTPIRANWPT